MTIEEVHLSLLEQTVLSACRVSASGGGESWVGSGFFYKVLTPGGLQSDLLIICKHVFDGADRINIEVRKREKSGINSNDFHEIIIDKSSCINISHPSEDLVAIFVHPYMKSIENEYGFWPLYFAIGDDHIPDFSSVDILEEVIMIGCPLGIFDKVNRFPIARRGITATHAAFNYNGNPRFLVDISSLDGSSGSPIFKWSTVSLNRATQRYDLYFEPRLQFLGVLSDGLDEQDGNGNTLQHSHLGVAVRADQIFVIRDTALEILARRG